MKERFIKKLFKWNPQPDAMISIAVGIIVVGLSVAMIYASENYFISIFLRDILMILLFGIGLPLFMINRKQSYKEYGLHVSKWYIFLPINLILGGLLLFMFLNEVPLPDNFVFTGEIFWKMAYIMLAGIFETIVFYSYIRTATERSFGIIPAILIAAVFYSLHHAGFQPEFGKLLFVGIMYALVFRIANSALLIYPFFWGVGACYDVLVQSAEVSDLLYPQARSVILIIGICVIIAGLIINRKRNHPSLAA
ncbi:MAG: hypothetical protein JXN64_05510 [Spirochaetes bacterium]|nr:hypothetical protein [Spirochaetota bacterium]